MPRIWTLSERTQQSDIMAPERLSICSCYLASPSAAEPLPSQAWLFSFISVLYIGSYSGHFGALPRYLLGTEALLPLAVGSIAYWWPQISSKELPFVHEYSLNHGYTRSLVCSSLNWDNSERPSLWDQVQHLPHSLMSFFAKSFFQRMSWMYRDCFLRSQLKIPYILSINSIFAYMSQSVSVA